MRKIIAIILLITTTSVYCTDNTPVPYEEEEFGPVLLDVRRASVIFCGAFPLGYMYSSIISDYVLPESDQYNDLDEVEKSNEEIKDKLVSSLIFSGIVMLIDFIIEKFF